MMTREMMIAAIEALGADASLWDEEDYCLDVTIENFGGYYVTYHFEGFDVRLGYASFDI